MVRSIIPAYHSVGKEKDYDIAQTLKYPAVKFNGTTYTHTCIRVQLTCTVMMLLSDVWLVISRYWTRWGCLSCCNCCSSVLMLLTYTVIYKCLNETPAHTHTHGHMHVHADTHRHTDTDTHIHRYRHTQTQTHRDKLTCFCLREMSFFAGLHLNIHS